MEPKQIVLLIMLGNLGKLLHMYVHARSCSLSTVSTAGIQAAAVDLSPFAAAILSDNGEALRDQLGHAFDVNAKDEDGKTLLLYASVNGAANSVAVLLGCVAARSIIRPYSRTDLRPVDTRQSDQRRTVAATCDQ